MIATNSPQLATGKRAVPAKKATGRKASSHARNSAAQQQQNKYGPVVTAKAVGTPMSDWVDSFGSAIVDGSPRLAEIVLNDEASDQSASLNQQPASDQAPSVTLQNPEQVDAAQDGPDAITNDQQFAAADSDTFQESFDTSQDDQQAGDDVEDLPIPEIELSSEQIAKINKSIQKVLGRNRDEKKEMINVYTWYADAWFQENEYGYRGRDEHSLTTDMKRYLDDELPDMLKGHSGHVAKGWRLKLWSAAAGSAGLVPYGKSVVGAVARLRTKQIISQKFAIAKIKTEKAEKKEKKKAEKRANKSKASTKDKKKEQAKQIASSVTGAAAEQLVGAAVDVPMEAASSAVNEAVQEAAQSALGEGVSEFLSDLASETFFSSMEELIHFLPIIGQVISVMNGYSKTSNQCKQDIQDAVKTALDEHRRTILPHTVTSMEKKLSQLGPRSSINITRLPSCAACFLSQTDQAGRDKPCQYCVTARQSSTSTSSLAKKFRHCRKGHDKHIPKEKTGFVRSLFRSKSFAPKHSHHKAWCTKALLAKSKNPKAWGCIPCFLKYGGHKKGKCMLEYSGDCTYCGVKGHHAGACGTRFFHAANLIRESQAAGIHREVQDKVLSVRHKRVEWVRIGPVERKAWSRIDSHVAVVGDNFGTKERYEASFPKDVDFKGMSRAMR